MSWTQEEADKVKAPNDRPKPTMQSDPDLVRSLRLPPRRKTILSQQGRELEIAARIAAVGAASRMYEGGFLRGEIDIEEFLGCAQDLEEWINRA